MTRARDIAGITDLANAKGDIYTATADNTPAVLTVGANNTLLVANSGATAGVNWSASLSGLTLTSPVISTITNTGTITLPTSTDTLVGRTTTDTLTNKTLTSPIENNPRLTAPKELWTVSATAATGTIQFDCITQGVLYYTTASSANWTLNFRGNSGATLASVMNTGDAITVNFLATNTTAYYQSTAVTVDTSATVAVKWSGGTAAASGNASAVDIYSYTILKTGSSAFTVLCAGPIKYA
jgi:hypothetical protein